MRLTLVVIALTLGAVAVLTAPAPDQTDAGVTDWRPHLARVDQALAGGNVSAALAAWREAHAAALASLRWEAMLEVGDGYLRIGDLVDFRRAFVDATRASYLIALFRARQQRSLDGVLRIAQAFATLGDGERLAQAQAIEARLRAERAR
jgi:hypothetical protein